MRFLLFIIFALISVGSGAQENKYGMTGRVVDKEGMAVMRASVTLTMPATVRSDGRLWLTTMECSRSAPLTTAITS